MKPFVAGSIAIDLDEVVSAHCYQDAWEQRRAGDAARVDVAFRGGAVVAIDIDIRTAERLVREVGERMRENDVELMRLREMARGIAGGAR